MSSTSDQSLAALEAAVALRKEVTQEKVAFRTDLKASVAAREGAEAALASSKELVASIEETLGSAIVSTEWSGTSVRFLNLDGTWTDFVDLRGAKGEQGVMGPPPVLYDEHVPGTTYAIGALLRHEGIIWRALEETELAPEAGSEVWAEWIDFNPALAAQQAAEDAADEAADNSAATEVARDAALAAKTAAEAASANAVAVTGLSDLSAAALRIVSAADVTVVHIYDTANDSDGGAWRHKMRLHGWMTGVFPSKALLVGQTNRTVKIYSLDDPTCPLVYENSPEGMSWNWAGYDGADLTALAARNGVIVIGSSVTNKGGVGVVDLIRNRLEFHRGVGTVSEGWWTADPTEDFTGGMASGGISIDPANDVAMTVLPGTRPDPNRCGLPAPTIAVATAGGLSIVLPDGRATHSAATGAVSSAAFLGNGDLVWQMPGTWGTQYTRRDQVLTTGFGQIAVGQIGDVVAFQGLAPLGGQRFAGWREGVDGQLDLIDLTGFRQSGGSELGAKITDTFTTGYHFAAVNGATRKTTFILADSSADLSDLVDGSAEDRSGADNHPEVTGTFTREPVAVGSELAALKGVGHAGMVLADIPWDTLKERAIILWSYPVDQNGSHVIAGWGLTAFNESAPPARWGLITGWTNTEIAGTMRFAERANNMLSRPIWPQRWYQVILGIRDTGGGTFRRELWVNGELHNSGGQGNPGIDPELPLRLFQGSSGADAPAWPTALLRYCDTMPSPAEIRSMYAAERPLFEPGARCLLPSCDVRAVAHDASRAETVVATAAGTAVFQGLRRIQTIDAAGVDDVALLSSDAHTAAAAADGIRVIGSTAEVYATLPAIPLREAALERRPAPVYDPSVVEASGVTADATPRDLLKLAIAEGFAAGFEATVSAAEHGNVDGERACYRITGHVARDYLGNVMVEMLTPPTPYESTGTMDAVAAADTTAQTLDLTVTGVASKTLVWSARLQLTEIGHAA
jgi:hypothetical protein